MISNIFSSAPHVNAVRQAAGVRQAKQVFAVEAKAEWGLSPGTLPPSPSLGGQLRACSLEVRAGANPPSVSPDRYKCGWVAGRWRLTTHGL